MDTLLCKENTFLAEKFIFDPFQSTQFRECEATVKFTVLRGSREANDLAVTG